MHKQVLRRDLCDRVVVKLKRLRVLLAAHDRHCWAVGDLMVELVHSHRVPLSIISGLVNYSRSRLSEFKLTAQAFQLSERTSFQDCLMARRIHSRLPTLGLSLIEVRDEIAQMHGKRPTAIKAHFIKMLMSRQSAISGMTVHANEISDRCIHSDWRAIIPRLPDKSVKMIHADPPYGRYSWQGDGGYISSRADCSGLRTDSDSNSYDAALSVTLPLFDLCLPKLADGGCLLLWQAGARPDSRTILQKAEESGWELPVALTWMKSGTGVADADCPYVPTTERVLIFVPRGTKLITHERGINRSDVLTFPSVTIRAVQQMLSGNQPIGSTHMFEKPVELMEHLIRKHSFPGELVVDCFGCSGSCCIAAARLNRRWCYIESNAENYRWGSERISKSLTQVNAVAS